MRNLAGEQGCDATITRELATANIPHERLPMGEQGGEVPYHYIGRLGPFTFRRAWYYWMVDGPVPLNAAKRMYAHPDGAKDVRVVGHCGCPPPGDPWLEYIDPETGKDVVPTINREGEDNRAQFEAFSLDTSSYMFVDDPAAVGKAVVPSYHIDTQEGLNLFAATMHDAGLVPEREERSQCL